MELEIGQVWYDRADDHIEIILKIDKEQHKVGVAVYERDGEVKPLTLEFVEDPIDVMVDGTTDFHLATTLDDILEICKNERRKEMY